MKNINIQRLGFIILLFSLVLTSACGGKSSSANIADAGLYFDPSGLQPTTTYEWRDVFYCVIHVSGATPETVVKASWVAVDTDRAAPNSVLKIEEKTAGVSPVIFKLENIGHIWPVGSYEVYIYLDGDLDRVLEFNVKEADLG